MDNALVKKYEEYKQVKESGFSNAERYRLLTKFVYTNPADGNEFLSLIKGKKDLNKGNKTIF
jgi:hypothetical protein